MPLAHLEAKQSKGNQDPETTTKILVVFFFFDETKLTGGAKKENMAKGKSVHRGTFF